MCNNVAAGRRCVWCTDTFDPFLMYELVGLNYEKGAGGGGGVHISLGYKF